MPWARPKASRRRGAEAIQSTRAARREALLSAWTPQPTLAATPRAVSGTLPLPPGHAQGSLGVGARQGAEVGPGTPSI